MQLSYYLPRTKRAHHTAPTIAPETWCLLIQADRRPPLLLTWDELQALPRVAIETALVCPHEPLTKAQTGLWTGAALKLMLPSRAGTATLSCADGHYTTLLTADLEDAVLAYQLNGTPLSPAQGAPVRVIVPGRSGCLSAKWLRRIEISTTAAGLRVNAETILPRVAFTSPAQQNAGDVLFTGIAYYPDGIVQVDISADDEDWRPAHIEAETDGLVRWSAHWHLPQSAGVVIRARAFSGDGLSSERTDTATSIFRHRSALHEDEMRLTLYSPGAPMRQEW